MTKSLRTYALSFLASIALSAAPALAQEAKSKLDEVLARGHLIVGTGSTNAPWHFKDASDKLVGFDVDMGHIIAKALVGDPEKVEYVNQSSDARIPNITTGKVDITCQFMCRCCGLLGSRESRRRNASTRPDRSRDRRDGRQSAYEFSLLKTIGERSLHTRMRAVV